MKARFLALAALVLGLASCQTEPEGLDVNVGGEVDTVVTVSLPETTRANSAVGAFDNVDLSGDKTIRYILKIYQKVGDEYKASTDRQVEYSDGQSVVFPVRLVPNRDYRFVVWADYVESKDDVDFHYNTHNEGELANITLNGEWKPMDETRDAFTGYFDTVDEGKKYTSTSSINITLTRPFAKLRVITTDMKELRYLDINPAYATVEYDTPYRAGFNAFESKAFDAGSEKKSHSTVFPIKDYSDFVGTTKEETHKVLFTDYLFAEQDVVKFTLSVYEDEAKAKPIKSNNFNTDIAVNRNYLTTIQGNILTDGNNITVTVENDGEFAGEKVEEIVEVGNATDLQEAINESTENTTIVLGSDIDLGDGIITLATTRAEAPQYALLVPAGKVVNLDLNGKTISQEKACTANYSMLVNKGTLTITGEGTISFKDTGAGDPNFGWGSYTLRNEGTLVVENGTIKHLGAQNPGNGQPNVHMYCAIFQYSGSTTINGGKISTPTYRSARLWSGDMTINGGEFDGQLWLQAVNNTADLTINGGEFDSNGNDSSSVFVTNSGKSVKFAVTGGFFNTKIGMSESLACITGGTFTSVAKENTNAALLANGYAFVEGENGTYTVENVGHYTDAEGNYYITNVKGLAWVSENVNTMEFYVSGSANIFDGKTVYLANDIDLGGAEWRPIGDYAFSRTSFNGVFDGQGYTVSNFKVTEPVRWTEKVTEASYGFFGNVKGTIKNLTIKNATVNPEGGRYSAALVGRLHDGGRIENCHVENSSVTILHWQVGGIVGQNNNGNIYNCSVAGSTITGKAAVGAIIGMDMKAGEHTIENCRIANTALVQNESFGASYDASYGLAVGLVNASGIVLNIDNVVAEKNTIKGEADNTLVGDIETGATVTINGVSIATTAEQLIAALKAGKHVVLSSDLTINENEMMTAPYGNKMALSQMGGVFDGNDNSIAVTAGGDNYVVMTNGGTIKNLDIDRGFRGIVLMSPKQDVYVDNVNIGVDDEVCYTINTAEGDGTHSLYVSNSVLNGWCSIGTAVKYVSFTDCTFGQGTYYTNVSGRLVKPYVDALFENCDFCNKCYIDLSAFVGTKVVVKNCTVNGVKITAENWTSLVAPESTCGEGQISVELKDGTFLTAENVADYIVFE